MKIIRAEHFGMCFGVRDAIALALTKAEESPLTILGELVHNEAVLATLQAKGIRIESRWKTSARRPLWSPPTERPRMR